MRICFIGDSFTNGYGDPAYQGWVGRVSAMARAAGCDLTAYNLGVRRETSADIRARWLQDVAPRLRDIDDGAVVFSFGTNDVTREESGPRLTPAQTVDNAVAILREARGHWPTLFISPPRSGDDIRDRDLHVRLDSIAALCADLQVPCLDVFGASARFKAWHAEAAAFDGAHPRADGYAEMAAVVAAWPAWRALIGQATVI